MSYKVRQGANGPDYTPSEIVTIKVSNGYLPKLDTPTQDDLKCLSAVANESRKLTNYVEVQLRKCNDKVLATLHLGRPANPALSACSLDNLSPTSLVTKLAAAKTRAITAIEAKCGTLSSSSIPFTASQVNTHLGMARCRGEEVSAATYANAADEIGEVLEAASLGTHEDVEAAFPCLKGGAAE